jgi:predicted KAP-like P-loop ATPase
MEAKNTPLALPVKIGTGQHGFNANVLYDANDNSLATLFGIPSNTSVEELRKLASKRPDLWADGLAKAECIIRAVNSHQKLVDALKDIKRRIEESDEWWMDSPDRGGFDLEAINAALTAAGAA